MASDVKRIPSEVPGWLAAVFADAKAEMETWPEWMRDAYRDWISDGR